MRLRTIIISAVVVVAAALATAFAIVLNMDFSQYRGLVIEKVKEATGRDLAIKGDLKVVVGLSPSLAVSDVSFSNAGWGSRPQMITAKRLEVQVDLLPLVTGNIRVRKLLVHEADILIETDARGRGNWEMEVAGAPQAAQAAKETKVTASPDEFRLPQIGEVDIEGALFVYRDGEARKTTRFSLGRLRLSAANDTAPLKIETLGTYNDFYFELAGQTGSAEALTSRGTKFPVDLTAKLGATDTVIRATGQLSDALAGKQYDVKLTASTAELANFGDFIRDAGFGDMKLPKLGPLKAELRVHDAANDGRPSISNLKVEAGKTDFALVKLEGGIRDVLAQRGVALDVSAEGKEVGAFSGFSIPAMPKPLPPIPALGPFHITAKVANQGERLALPALKAELGSDDLLKLVVEGSIGDPLTPRGVSLDIAADAKDLSALGKKLDLPIPLDGPGSLRAKVADTAPDRYTVTGLKLQASGSDVGGEATLSLAGPRPNLTANLASTLIDLGKLMARKDSPAPAPASTTPAARGQAPPPKSDGKIFPADPLPFETLNSADAELRYRAEAIRTPGGPAFRDVVLQSNLRDGELNMRQLSGDIGNGKIAAELTLSARTGAVTAKLSAKGVDLGAIDKEVPGDDLVNGARTDIDMDLRGNGRSIRAQMAGLNGTVFLSIGPGTFTSRYADVLGFGDLMEIVGKSLPAVERTQLNCIVGRLDVNAGIATPRVLVADTARLTLAGTGSVNLAREELALLFDTHTKVTSLLSILPPIRVRGTLAEPDFGPDLGAAAGSAIGNVIGGLLRAPGNILGGGQRPESNACANALAQATGRAAPAAQQAPAQQTPAQPQQQPRDPIQDLGRGIERNLRGIFGR